MFEIKAKDGKARVGVLKTNHGDVKTPNLIEGKGLGKWIA